MLAALIVVACQAAQCLVVSEIADVEIGTRDQPLRRRISSDNLRESAPARIRPMTIPMLRPNGWKAPGIPRRRDRCAPRSGQPLPDKASLSGAAHSPGPMESSSVHRRRTPSRSADPSPRTGPALEPETAGAGRRDFRRYRALVQEHGSFCRFVPTSNRLPGVSELSPGEAHPARQTAIPSTMAPINPVFRFI